MKINKPEFHVCQGDPTTTPKRWCVLPENVPSKSAISRILNSDLGCSYQMLSVIPRETEREDVVKKLQTYIAEVSAIDPT